MEAGIEDKNFATAIYDSFASANYFGDETKDVRQILMEYEGTIEAANKGIKSIYGIEWLKNATLIDLKNQTDTDIKNYIGDLRPLSMEYIMKTADVTEDEAREWYRKDCQDNLLIDLSGNPISNYKQCVGQMLIMIDAQYAASFEGYYLNAIKTGVVDWSVDLKVDTPEIHKDDQRVKFSKEPYKSTIIKDTTTVNDDIAINYDAVSYTHLDVYKRQPLHPHLLTFFLIYYLSKHHHGILQMVLMI